METAKPYHKYIVKGFNPGVISQVGWVWLSGWTYSWIGLLLTVTDVSTTCTVVTLSQRELYHVSWWYLTLAINLVGQLSRDLLVVCQLRDVIGYLICLLVQLNSRLLLVKLLAVQWFSSSYFCLSPSISCLYDWRLSGVCSKLVNHLSKMRRW